MRIKLTTEENKQIEIMLNEYHNYSNYIPERIKKILDKLPEEGYIIFSNINQDNQIPLTPTENSQNIGSQTKLAKLQGIIMSYISHLVGYEGECGGSLFQDIIPVKKTEQMQISTGSRNELEVHTEQAFSLYRPDYISLACLRGSTDAITYLLDIEEIKKHLTEREYNMLWLPLWMIGIDASFLLKEIEEKKQVRGPFPMLSKKENKTYFIFDKDLMRGITEESNELIDKITKIYENNRLGYCLQAGEIMIIDNRRIIHGRSSFCPKYDGTDRFLVRSFGVEQLNPEIMSGNIILSKYS